MGSAREDLTRLRGGRTLSLHPFRPAPSSMPQTTIYVAPRLAGTLGTIPPAVATVELARLFGRSAALAGVSLTIEIGRTVALLGPNGAGKTTLLRLCATAIRPSYGTLAIDGIDAQEHPELIRGRVVYLSHATGHYDDLTARENLRFAATMFGWGEREGDPVVREALDTVGLAAVAGGPGAAPSRPACASAWPLPACSWRGPRSCSSTSRTPPSTGTGWRSSTGSSGCGTRPA